MKTILIACKPVAFGKTPTEWLVACDRDAQRRYLNIHGEWVRSVYYFGNLEAALEILQDPTRDKEDE